MPRSQQRVTCANNRSKLVGSGMLGKDGRKRSVHDGKRLRSATAYDFASHFESDPSTRHAATRTFMSGLSAQNTPRRFQPYCPRRRATFSSQVIEKQNLLRARPGDFLRVRFRRFIKSSGPVSSISPRAGPTQTSNGPFEAHRRIASSPTTMALHVLLRIPIGEPRRRGQLGQHRTHRLDRRET